MGNGEAPERLDFAALFPTCRCGGQSCDSCSIFQVTPRTAAALWFTAQLLAELAQQDIRNHGDQPVVDDGSDWGVFGDYPTYTWAQDAQWRRQAACAFDDLAGDLAAGRAPQRTCPADVMALHMMMQIAPDAVAESWPGLPELLDALPTHPHDLDWKTAQEQLLLDTDLTFMFDLSVEAFMFDLSPDGIESADSDSSMLVGIGDFRPSAWFTPFKYATPRDPR